MVHTLSRCSCTLRACINWHPDNYNLRRVFALDTRLVRYTKESVGVMYAFNAHVLRHCRTLSVRPRSLKCGPSALSLLGQSTLRAIYLTANVGSLGLGSARIVSCLPQSIDLLRVCGHKLIPHYCAYSTQLIPTLI